MKKLSRKVMALTVVFGLCCGVAVLQKEKQVNEAEAVAALLTYDDSFTGGQAATRDQMMAGSVASTYVGTCVSIGVQFIWGGPIGIAAGVVAGL